MSRVAAEIDCAPYADAMAAALRAYTEDVGYAVAMLTSARTIQRKRLQWQARRKIRLAEADARAACESGPDFICAAEVPCGIGRQCRYSLGAMRDLVITEQITRSGSLRERPQLGPGGTPTFYNSELAVEPRRAALMAASGSPLAAPEVE